MLGFIATYEALVLLYLLRCVSFLSLLFNHICCILSLCLSPVSLISSQSGIARFFSSSESRKPYSFSASESGIA